MFTIKNFRHLLWGALVLGASHAQGQTTVLGNSGATTDFLGWDNIGIGTNNFPLQVRHDRNQPIEWYTDAIKRMQLQPTVNPNIGAFSSMPTDGFLAISAARSIIHEIYHVPQTVIPAQGWWMMRVFLKRSAQQIRREDALFSRRRFNLRQQGFVDGRGLPINGKVAPYLDEWEDSAAAEAAASKLSTLVGKKAPSHW